MASDKRVFPIISSRAWWDLRRAFSRSLPGEVNARYLATVLDMSERAAANVLPNLRRVGLVDDAGAPTERAVLWRDDAHYPEVCSAIVGDVYPKQLTDALPPPDPDRERVTSWFARETRTGEAASSQMGRLYILLTQRDVRMGEERLADLPVGGKSGGGAPRKPAPPGRSREDQAAVAAEKRAPEVPKGLAPDVHIDIQVHIDASASPEQIEQIFKSMAKHLYGRE